MALVGSWLEWTDSVAASARVQSSKNRRVWAIFRPVHAARRKNSRLNESHLTRGCRVVVLAGSPQEGIECAREPKGRPNQNKWHELGASPTQQADRPETPIKAM